MNQNLLNALGYVVAITNVYGGVVAAQVPDKELSMDEQLEKVYMAYQDQKQSLTPLSKGVWYLGYFVGFGEVWARHKIWTWKKSFIQQAHWLPIVRSQAFQEKCLDATLADLKNCVILSTTPTCFSQYQNACLLKSRGFQLLDNSCQLHPGYSFQSPKERMHPGIPDRYEHYEHIWWKVQGQPTDIGVPTNVPGLNNCGVDAVVGLNGITAHDSGDRRGYMCVGWLPRGTKFPNGWKRFFSGEDYKLGHNFEARGAVMKLLRNVQTCPHKFDLKIFEGWMPDFDKASPS